MLGIFIRQKQHIFPFWVNAYKFHPMYENFLDIISI